jgi:hypothetical protein
VNALSNLSDIGFVLLVLAILATLVQLALLSALALRGASIGVAWGFVAVALWIGFWFLR